VSPRAGSGAAAPLLLCLSLAARRGPSAVGALAGGPALAEVAAFAAVAALAVAVCGAGAVPVARAVARSGPRGGLAAVFARRGHEAFEVAPGQGRARGAGEGETRRAWTSDKPSATPLARPARSTSGVMFTNPRRAGTSNHNSWRCDFMKPRSFRSGHGPRPANETHPRHPRATTRRVRAKASCSKLVPEPRTGLSAVAPNRYSEGGSIVVVTGRASAAGRFKVGRRCTCGRFIQRIFAHATWRSCPV